MSLHAIPDEGLRVIELPEGGWQPAIPPNRLAVVTRGLLVRELTLDGTISSEMLGPGDLVIGVGGAAQSVTWIVAAPARLLLVTERELTTPAGSSTVGARLLESATQQLGRSAMHAAICRLPRVEDRLVALMWHLAERWGRVTADGVVVPLEFTHSGLGHLVGARRPTVSLALKAAAAGGRMRRLADGSWLLDPAGAHALAAAADEPRSRSAPVRPRAMLTPMTALKAAVPEGRASRHDALAARIDHLHTENMRIRRRLAVTLSTSGRLCAATAARRASARDAAPSEP